MRHRDCTNHNHEIIIGKNYKRNKTKKTMLLLALQVQDRLHFFSLFLKSGFSFSPPRDQLHKLPATHYLVLPRALYTGKSGHCSRLGTKMAERAKRSKSRQTMLTQYALRNKNGGTQCLIYRLRGICTQSPIGFYRAKETGFLASCGICFVSVVEIREHLTSLTFRAKMIRLKDV